MKDESVYNDVYNKRITRLELYKAVPLTGGIKKDVGKSIRLTKECHQLASNLKSTYTRLANSIVTDTEKILEQIIAVNMKAAKKSKNSKHPFSESMLDLAINKQEEEYEIAKQLILEASKSSKWNKKQTMLEFVDSKYPEDGSFERTSLRMTVALLVNSYQTHISTISLFTDFIKISVIFRELFYMGIVDYQGSELDEKQLQKDLVGFLEETTGVLAPPIISNLVGLFKMINKAVDVIMDLHELDVPEIMKELQKLTLYLSKYQTSLIAWKYAAKSLIPQLENIGNSINHAK